MSEKAVSITVITSEQRGKEFINFSLLLSELRA